MKFDLQSLNIYAVKSCRGQILRTMEIQQDGPAGDRQWMLVNEQGKFLSQRECPKMATLETHWDPTGLTIAFNKQFFKITNSSVNKRTMKVQIWSEEVEASLEADLYSQGISQYLGVNCRLVRYTDLSHRPLKSVTENWSPEVRFADGRPLLLMNTASLAELNGRLSTPVGVDRFRPNIVVNGNEAFQEDLWKRIKIGPVVFSQPKKCSRCVMINIDQNTGIKAGAEPLKTLASYRNQEGKVNMGVLWIPENTGMIQSSDCLEILSL